MSRWLVKIEGASFDLEDFPYWFPRGDVFATSDAEGTYLTGEIFEACDDPASVHQTAESMLDEMHAVISLLDPGIKKPTIGVVLRENDSGKRTGTAYASAIIRGRTKARATLSVGGPGSTNQSQTQAQVLLQAARTNRHLRIALSLLAMPHVSWPHLYRAIEEIEAFLNGKVHDVGICSSHERGRFTRSANSGEIAGNEARHRVGKFAPPPQPMTLRDARTFVRHCLDGTLRRVEATRPNPLKGLPTLSN